MNSGLRGCQSRVDGSTSDLPGSSEEFVPVRPLTANSQKCISSKVHLLPGTLFIHGSLWGCWVSSSSSSSWCPFSICSVANIQMRVSVGANMVDVPELRDFGKSLYRRPRRMELAKGSGRIQISPFGLAPETPFKPRK